jgi:hypothetical protein
MRLAFVLTLVVASGAVASGAVASGAVGSGAVGSQPTGLSADMSPAPRQAESPPLHQITKNNDNSCDVTVLPAALLLRTSRSTSITNVTNADRDGVIGPAANINPSTENVP